MIGSSHIRSGALGATDAILAILEINTDAINTGGTDDSPPNKISLIDFKDVSKSYGKRRVLTAINLHIAAGEQIALIGESGAGKTTLLNIIVGKLKLQNGNSYQAFSILIELIITDYTSRIRTFYPCQII